MHWVATVTCMGSSLQRQIGWCRLDELPREVCFLSWLLQEATNEEELQNK